VRSEEEGERRMKDGGEKGREKEERSNIYQAKEKLSMCGWSDELWAMLLPLASFSRL
jgi:hypothetical protein